MSDLDLGRIMAAHDPSAHFCTDGRRIYHACLIYRLAEALAAATRMSIERARLVERAEAYLSLYLLASNVLAYHPGPDQMVEPAGAADHIRVAERCAPLLVDYMLLDSPEGGAR